MENSFFFNILVPHTLTIITVTDLNYVFCVYWTPKRKIVAKFNNGGSSVSLFSLFSCSPRLAQILLFLTGYPQKLVHVIVSSRGLTKTSRRACTICDMNSQAGSINFHCRDCGIWLRGIPNLFANKRCIFIPWPLWRVGDAPFLGCIYSIYIYNGWVCSFARFCCSSALSDEDLCAQEVWASKQPRNARWACHSARRRLISFLLKFTLSWRK